MVYKEKYRIGIEDVAHNSRATNKALLSIMEDISSIIERRALLVARLLCATSSIPILYFSL